jgi:hypothetical protein
LGIKLKKDSYLLVSKSLALFGKYFLGLPLPLFSKPVKVSGCFVFL